MYVWGVSNGFRRAVVNVSGNTGGVRTAVGGGMGVSVGIGVAVG